MRNAMSLLVYMTFLSGCVDASVSYTSPPPATDVREGEIDDQVYPEGSDEPEVDPNEPDGGSTDETDTNNTPESTACDGEDHPGAIWTTHDCGPYNMYSVPTSGMPTPYKGRVTFKIKNLDRSEIADDGEMFLLFGHFMGNGGGEVNFEIILWDSDKRDNITTYLISQRHDGTCSPYCERQDSGSGVRYDRNVTYHFNIEWDTTTVRMTITDGRKRLYSGSVPTDGPYYGLRYFNIGNDALPGYAGVRSTLEVTDIRFSIFN